MDEIMEKKIQLDKLYGYAACDPLIRRFFDDESEEMLDEKIQVFTDLKNGKAPIDIPNYYKILELYPTDPHLIWD